MVDVVFGGGLELERETNESLVFTKMKMMKGRQSISPSKRIDAGRVCVVITPTYISHLPTLFCL